MKPSDSEEEYFAREEIERRRKYAAERSERDAAEERERVRVLHSLKCPKCDMPLETIMHGDVHVDQCCSCNGMWLDKGELERLQGMNEGLLRRLLGAFRS